MELHSRLIRIIDAYLTTFDGSMRLQGIHALLLLEKASRFGNGISRSDMHRLTGAPMENIRRRLQRFTAQHLVESHADPRDDRITLFRMTEAGLKTWPAETVARALYADRLPGRETAPPRSICPETYDALIAVLEAFSMALDPGIRIRGFKTALLIQQATLTGKGITATTLARLTNAAPETVRRHMTKHTELGDLRMVEDPQDERATRVFTAHPERESRAWSAVARRIDALDWSVFNIA